MTSSGMLNTHEAFFDQDLFERGQAKMQARRRSNPGVSYRTHTKANDDAYLLSGLVFCADCGCKMHGNATLRRKNGKEHRYSR